MPQEGLLSDIGARKSEHLDIVLNRDVQARATLTGFDDIRFEHAAAPELNFDAIDLSTQFLGFRLAAPLLISSMTGGPTRAAAINAAIAEAASATGIALAVGSQRIAVEGGGVGGFTRELRARARNVPILANLGAAQLREPGGLDAARTAIEMIDANALIIHLNPLQEAVQPGGDRDWTGVLDSLEEAAKVLPVPIVVKEVGCGISGTLARRLASCGVSIIDIAGAGGTSWAAVEAERAHTPRDAAIASAFREWGIPTAVSLRDVRAARPDATLIASGGMKTGLDAAKAIRLGADLAGFAAGVLPAALDGAAALASHIEVLVAQLRIACFCTASPNLDALRAARLITSTPATPPTLHPRSSEAAQPAYRPPQRRLR
jgi:isopentenyl-diphosphate Delta-isomerase